MKLLSVLAAMSLAGGVASAEAQSWTAIGTPDNSSAGSQFWDNPSWDGAHCNAGYVVTGVAGSAGNACANQRPSSWLPYAGATPTSYLTTAAGGFQAFSFGAGSYTLSLLAGASASGGDIAGANQDWGYFDVNTNVRTSLNGGLPSGPVTMTDPWGLYIQLTNGNYAYSTSDNQFALFGFNAPGSFTGFATGDTWLSGMEDIATGNGASDTDYQDELFQIDADGIDVPHEVTPEPATMTLLATGLIGLAAMKRRKRV